MIKTNNQQSSIIMSSSKCARCDKTVYPVEGLRCLDKLWHKGCFKCHECNMTLNMKNYKGFEKRPYCNAHCPQAKATTVADTPESRRLAENTRIQSQAKYHEDFEKSKGKNFTTIADDPETRRVKETSKIISNASYHGEMDRKKQMEEKRGLSGQDDSPLSRVSNSNSIQGANNNNSHSNNANNSSKHRVQSNNNNNSHDYPDMTPTHQAQLQQQQQHRLIQQQQQQQQQYLQKQQQAQQLLLKQQQQQQQYVQPMMNRQSSGSLIEQQQSGAKNAQQHSYQVSHAQQHQQQQQQIQLQIQQQQQMLMRQQQQQILMQQHRQSMDASVPMSRQVSKQAIVSSSSNNNNHPIMKNHPNMMPAQHQQPIKYMPINDAMLAAGQPLPHHLVGVPPHMVSHQMGGGLPPPQHQQQQNNRRMAPQPSGPQAAAHPMAMHGYNNNQHHPIGSMNGVMPNKHSAPMGNIPPPHLAMQHHPDMQIQQQQQQQMNQRMQMRPASIAGGQPMVAMPQQVPRRVFRAMYDYSANDVDEVSFLENDILIDCVNVDRNWLIGKVARSGQTGMLPANYVEQLPSQ